MLTKIRWMKYSKHAIQQETFMVHTEERNAKFV